VTEAFARPISHSSASAAIRHESQNFGSDSSAGAVPMPRTSKRKSAGILRKDAPSRAYQIVLFIFAGVCLASSVAGFFLGFPQFQIFIYPAVLFASLALGFDAVKLLSFFKRLL
jgi:hypothetical protein